MGIIDAKNAGAPPQQSMPLDEPESTSDRPDEPEGQEAGGDQPAPQEQDAMDRVVLASLKVIYDPKTHQGIVNGLTQGKDDPSKALADATTLIITQVDQASGGKVPEQVILPAAADVLGELANLAMKAGIFQVDEKTSNIAMQKTMAQLAEAYGVTPEQTKQFMDSIDPEEGKKMLGQQSAMAQPASPQPAAQPVPAVG
jgi:hypothetical protein